MKIIFGRQLFPCLLLVVLGVVVTACHRDKPEGKDDGLPPALSVDLGGGTMMEFVLIPAGSFMMGSEEYTGDGDESPVHPVQISQPFYLGRHEVTQAQWERLMKTNPSKFHGPALPVESVSWNDCQKFLTAFAQQTGKKIVLPTEAQWEYACRSGSTAPWSFSAKAEDAPEYAWMAENAAGTTHPVGQKKPNAWGLRDMHGNVWEWCSDWYAKHAYTDAASVDPAGPKSGESRVLRGGAWSDQPDGFRCAIRNCNGPDGANHGIGFRCVLPVDAAAVLPATR